MIEGLKVTIKGAELKELCLTHRVNLLAKAETIKKQLATLKESGLDEQMRGKSVDAGSELQEKQKRCEGDAQQLTFIAAHLVETEDYLLDQGDLVRIGIVTSHSRW